MLTCDLLTHPQVESPEAFQKRCADAIGSVPMQGSTRPRQEAPQAPQARRTRRSSVVDVISKKLSTIKAGSYVSRAPKARSLPPVEPGAPVSEVKPEPGYAPKKACCIVM